MKQSKFLSLKEFVIVLLLACVETAIGLVVTMPFAANLQLVYFLAPGLAGLFNGIIYVLIIKKCPKIGTEFIIPAIYGLYFLFSGSVYVFIFFMILAVVNELIMLGGGYRSKIRSAVPHTLTWMLNAMGSTLTMLLFRDSLVESYVSMGMDAASADAAIASLEASGWRRRTLPSPWWPAAALSIAGYALGMKWLGKHLNRPELRNGSRKTQALSAGPPHMAVALSVGDCRYSRDPL